VAEFFLRDPSQDRLFGPYAAARIKQLAATGRIGPTWLISRSQDGPWMTAAKVAGLFPAEAGEIADVRPAVQVTGAASGAASALRSRPSAGPAARAYTGPDTSLDDITFWVRRLASVLLVLNALMALWSVVAWALTATAALARESLATLDGAMTLLVSFPAVLVGLAYCITFWIWVYRATRRLRERPGTAMRFTPGWAVGWWFVPFANLYKPYQGLHDIWRASHGRGGADASLLAWWWWGLEIACPVLIWSFVGYSIVQALGGTEVSPGFQCATNTFAFCAGVTERLLCIAFVSRVRDAFRARIA
jgi:hypothetical protein